MDNFEDDVLKSELVKLMPELFKQTYEMAELRPLLQDDKTIDEILRSELPEYHIEVEQIKSEILSLIQMCECNIMSPKYYGYITPRPLPISVMGDWIALLRNQTPGAKRAGPLAARIESIVVKWIAQFVGIDYECAELPPGIITSGGSMSNLMGIHLGREVALNQSVKIEDIKYYVGENAHLSVFRAVNILGARKKNIRVVPLDRKQRMDVEALKRMILEDTRQGYYPAVVIGTYGTTSIGAIDDILMIKEIADKHNIWFHIDAASGGAFAGIDQFAEKNGTLKNGDSVSIDPSKWLFMSYGIGCLLVKDVRLLADLYSVNADYWESMEQVDFFQMSFTCTRPWRSLGVYMSFCHLGKKGYRELLLKICAISDALQKELKNIGCVVERGSDLPIIAFALPIDIQHKSGELIERAISKNIAYMTLVQLRNEKYIRVAISNYQTKISDIILLVEFVEEFIETERSK